MRFKITNSKIDKKNPDRVNNQDLKLLFASN